MTLLALCHPPSIQRATFQHSPTQRRPSMNTPLRSSSPPPPRWIRPPSSPCPTRARSTLKARPRHPGADARDLAVRHADRHFGGEPNRRSPSTTVPAPYTDPDARSTSDHGLPLRASGSRSAATPRSCRPQQRVRPRPGCRPQARRAALPGLHASRAAPGRPNVMQMHYARRGIITPEMEFVAIREIARRVESLKKQRPDGARRWRAC